MLKLGAISRGKLLSENQTAFVEHLDTKMQPLIR